MNISRSADSIDSSNVSSPHQKPMGAVVPPRSTLVSTNLQSLAFEQPAHNTIRESMLAAESLSSSLASLSGKSPAKSGNDVLQLAQQNKQPLLNFVTLSDIVKTLGASTAMLPSSQKLAQPPEFKSSSSDSKKSPLAESKVVINEATKRSYATPQIPANEQHRLKLLHQLKILDTNPQDEGERADPDQRLYDNLTAMASKLFDMPISCISLIDEKRQWNKSHHNFGAEAPRAASICAHAINTPDEVFYVPDLKKDKRFAGNPFVEDGSIAFYAGAPLVFHEQNGEGGADAVLGTFCVMDTKPRTLTQNQKDMLKMLAQQAQTEIQLRYTVRQLEVQNMITDKLLNNLLPPQVIARLKAKTIETKGLQADIVIADSFKSASAVFFDIVGFNQMSATMSPEETTITLGAIWAKFDKVAAMHRVTKIKTMGDAYMAATGVPQEHPDHAQDIVDFSMDCFKALEKVNTVHNTQVRMRCGINSGPMVGGVIGQEKFTYDIFGDSVNLASRMQSTGATQKVHISENTYKLVQDQYECTKLAPVECKGFGLVQSYQVEGKKTNIKPQRVSSDVEEEELVLA